MDIISVVLGIWFLALGFYCIYFGASMKKTGTIKAGWLVSKDIQLSDCRDIPGYIRFAYPRTMVFAAVVIAMGVLLLIAEAVKMYALSACSMLVLIIIYIWYTVRMSGAQKKYLTKKLSTRARWKRK